VPWSFRPSIKLAPGLRLNLSRRGAGISAGVRGARLTFGPRGIYRTLSIPGTGLYNRARIDARGAAPGASLGQRLLGCGCLVLILLAASIIIGALARSSG
jgi:hypothetical protein